MMRRDSEEVVAAPVTLGSGASCTILARREGKTVTCRFPSSATTAILIQSQHNLSSAT